LTFNETASLNGYIVGEDQYPGTFTVFPDCSGGTLLFNLSANRQQFNFYFEKGGTEIVLVSTDQADTIRGKAKAGPPAACGPDPLQALSGNWTFGAGGFTSGTTPYASAGYFAAAPGTNRSGGAAGLLKIADTFNAGGQITDSATGSGTYTIFPDCSGGTLFIPSATVPRSFNFYFVSGDAGFYFVGTDSGVTVSGEAAKM
jgi:hypothetical protein